MNIKEHKQQLLDNLYAPYLSGQKHPILGVASQRFVAGHGNANAFLMLIGEAPGREEDEQQKPFVGRSGKLLNKVLELAGTSRELVFISNVVKYRPPNNRKPLPPEIDAQKSILLQEIAIIKPKVIVTLGASAIQGLLANHTLKISAIRGKQTILHATIIIPSYHPAYILRNPKELQTLYGDIKHALSHCQSANC